MVAKRFPVEEGSILSFARSIGDPNPIYSDAHYAATTEVGGIIAPPTYVQVSAQFDPDYSNRPAIGDRWYGSAGAPTGDRGDAPAGEPRLHAEQHYEYHRVLRPGDVLSTRWRRGRGWAKQGRAGLLRFDEEITEYYDASGELVVTARQVAVTTEHIVGRDGGGDQHAAGV
jgi:hypothetical protein